MEEKSLDVKPVLHVGQVTQTFVILGVAHADRELCHESFRSLSPPSFLS